MPLGIGYPDEEEERRRRRMLPPPFPDAAMPAVTPRAPTAIPGAAMPPPPVVLDPPTRGQRLESERDAFMRGTPGRGRSALTGALQGFLGGGGLVGAALGGARGAIDPKGLREAQFNERVRPGVLERFAMEDADAQRMRQAEEDALNNQLRTAQIGELNRRNLPEPPKRQPLMEIPRGVFDPESRSIIPGTEPLPSPVKEDLRFTNQGLIDISKTTPEQRQKLTPYQRPREKGSGGGGGAGGSSQKDMRAANVEMRMFQRLKGEADRANREGDEETFAAKMAELQDAADRIDALYGDTVEVGVGEGGWPYVKFRQAGRGKSQSTPVAQKQSNPGGRSRKESYKILRDGGFTDAQANKELDRLGIK